MLARVFLGTHRLGVCRSVANGMQLRSKWTQHGSEFGAAYFVPFRTHRGAWGTVRIVFGSVSAPIGMHRGSFGSQLRPIQHPSGGRSAHSDRNCVPFNTHRGVRKPVFDVPKIMTHKKRLFSRVLTSQKLGRQTSEQARNCVCVLLRFRRSRGHKHSKRCRDGPHAPTVLGGWPIVPDLIFTWFWPAAA